MPSIGAATAVAISQRVNDMIFERIPPNKQSDAHYLVQLSARGGENIWITLAIFAAFAIFIGIMLVVFNESSLASRLVAASVCLLLAVTLSGTAWWVYADRLSARNEMKQLLRDDPDRWDQLMKDVKQIILEAGEFPEGQRTSIDAGG